jgi:DNA-binding transcriptional LysR family regulator
LEKYRAIEDQVLKLRDKVVGMVRVVAIYSVNLLQMDSYVKRFGELYPDAKLRVEYQHPERVYEQVTEDEVDLGLVSFPRDRGEVTNIPWQEQPMGLVVPVTHRLAGRSSIPVQELNGEDFVGFTADLTIRKQIDRWLRQSRIAVNVVHEFDNIENIKRAVEVGSGVAILPVPTIRREVEAGSLVLISLEDVTWLRPLGIVHKRHKVLSNAVQKFIELLHQDPTTFPRGGNGVPEQGADPAASDKHDAGGLPPHTNRLQGIAEPLEKKRKSLTNLR